MANRLAHEHSPYLLQHADNPVDWAPWDQHALSRARDEQKPIFLSIGYSTCHWCHVMAHESFEDTAVAAILNEAFVPIKVDREERPDLDHIYMTFVQATTGSGGWPMSVWLTPDLEPFYGGTYFPPAARWNKPGFADLLREIARLWATDRDHLVNSAHRLVTELRGLQPTTGRGDVPPVGAVVAAAQEYQAAFDARWGGFGQAPRFPRPSELLFLLRAYSRSGDARLLHVVERTLQAIALGGMRDHIGGGFHRYAVDEAWRVPHFEKMLYDQAQLVVTCLEAFQATGDGAYAEVAVDTLAYVMRDLRDSAGGFCSAEDADSVAAPRCGRAAPQATEGAFYLWRTTEVESVCGEDAALVNERYGFEPTGNAPYDPHQEFGCGNIPYVAVELEAVAAHAGISLSDAAERLDGARQRLFAAREQRSRPHRDDKVLSGWNGLMLGACARAARVLGQDDYLATARVVAAFLRRDMWDESTRQLYRRYRRGQRGIPAFADDYAAVAWGMIELFQATGDPDALGWAITLQREMDARFWDERGGWFGWSATDPSLTLRLREDYDGAEPAPSSLGAINLVTLAVLTGDQAWHTRVEQVFQGFAERLTTAGRAMPLMLGALAAYHAGMRQIVVIGAPDDDRTAALLAAASQSYRPFDVVVPVAPGEWATRLAGLVPGIRALSMLDETPTAFVCGRGACRKPVHDPAVLQAM